MANTIFNNLGKIIRGYDSVSPDIVRTPAYGNTSDRVIFSTTNRDEYEKKMMQFRQQKLMSYQWVKAGADAAVQNMNNYSAVRLMYRDADLMDGPEIGAALDIIKDEACCFTSKGTMLNITSKSPRVKAMLEDLFLNRLGIHVNLPMVCRDMVKYGNAFMLLNIDKDNGILGWRKLDVYTTNRIENNFGNMYGAGAVVNQVNDLKPDSTYFVREGYNESNPYEEWQVAHFRLLNDSFFLPYGTSHLHKARRAWRMWSMMEDAMLIYVLDKSVERRVYKIYVGGIDNEDVQAYVNDIANNFKRTPMIDPETGQVDLRRNFLDVSSDYFIPVRDENAANPIDTLQSGNAESFKEPLEYMRDKICAAIRVPKMFLNFQDAQGKGQNMSFADTRFARMINSVQQFLLMELTKIAQIHLAIMGFKDELSNFSLSLNNPSSLIESQELDDLNKRIGILAAALADPGTGIPMVSMKWGLTNIMKMSPEEIKTMMQEIYLEKGIAGELAQAQSLVKETGIFTPVKNIYGDYDAMNGNAATNGGASQEDPNGGGVGGGAPMPPAGGGMDDLGAPGGDDMGDMSGEEGETDMADAPAADAGGLMENRRPIFENAKSVAWKYFAMLDEEKREENDFIEDVVDFDGKNYTNAKKVTDLFETIDKLIEDKSLLEEDIDDDDTLI